MIVAVLSGFIVAILLIFFGKYFRGKASVAFSALPLALFVYFLSMVPVVSSGNTLSSGLRWIPSLNVHLNFFADGLSLLFALLITGIGFLVFLYASNYLKGHIYIDRFFGYLSMFMGSMLGLVLSDNVLTLFIFWELTSISSFFLIGFDNDNEESRKNSLLALAITGGGGFFLLAGFILLGYVGGTLSIQEMLQLSEVIKGHQLYPWILAFVVAGAFTKSAQFPFHFWLPGAMKAPTPVSAYLHSATMVKAGIYLLARFTPVLGSHYYWNTTLLIIGAITMLYAAFHAIIRTDLKSILAYSTVSALGMLTFLIGLGTKEALIAASVFILVHALYKAALFLTAGVIDHETGIRDVTKLAGLRKVLLPVAIGGTLAALSNAGIPFTFGFLGKDLIYEATLAFEDFGIWFTAAAVITNIFLLYAGFIAGIKPFTGKLPVAYKDVHLPSAALWLPALLLGVAGLFFGVFPAVIDKSIIQPVVLAIHGSAVDIPLKIWHGFNKVLLLSIITITAGFLLFYLINPSNRYVKFIGKIDFLSPQQILSNGAYKIQHFSAWYTKTLQNGYLRLYVMVIVFFLMALLAYKLFTGVYIYIDSSQFHELTLYEVMVTGIMFIAILITVLTSSRLTAVASMGVVGYCLCLLFVFYSAPDLAMTQFTIDTLTVVLFVLVLFKLPPFISFANTTVKIRDAVIALSFGSLISIIALEVLNETVEKETSIFYGENSYALAKGKNIVNVILVDFRGMDTLVEIIVLTIAAIGVFSLLKFKISANENDHV
ncbi:MAG: putative monovalent cation/H+ antiporter subunit A [Chitinophagaceae bacterium]